MYRIVIENLYDKINTLDSLDICRHFLNCLRRPRFDGSKVFVFGCLARSQSTSSLLLAECSLAQNSREMGPVWQRWIHQTFSNRLWVPQQSTLCLAGLHRLGQIGLLNLSNTPMYSKCTACSHPLKLGLWGIWWAHGQIWMTTGAHPHWLIWG